MQYSTALEHKFTHEMSSFLQKDFIWLVNNPNVNKLWILNKQINLLCVRSLILTTIKILKQHRWVAGSPHITSKNLTRLHHHIGIITLKKLWPFDETGSPSS